MDSSWSHQSESPKPKRLKTLAYSVKFPGRNTLLHQFVIDSSDPNVSCSGNYMRAVLLSMHDVPASAVNALNDEGFTALQLAVLKKNLTMVNKLLSCLTNIDVNARCGRGDQNTALHLAVESGHLSIIQELFNKGASIAILNRAEDTALTVAMKLRALDTVKILVSADVNQHIPFNTPLHEAACFRSLEIIEFLIDQGAEIDPRDEFGGTPLHYAVYMGHLDTVKLLVGKGADLHATDDNGWTPLHSAVYEGRFKCTAFLLDHGADLHATDIYGYTPLRLAAHQNVIDLLLDNGADASAIRDQYGNITRTRSSVDALRGPNRPWLDWSYCFTMIVCFYFCHAFYFLTLCCGELWRDYFAVGV